MALQALKSQANTLSLSEVTAFLFSEARALDDREWDRWLEHYDPDAYFHMPAWDEMDTLTEDPQTEVSLMFYPSRAGLEDRVFRIKTDRSSATSLPEPRTSHNISNIEIISQSGTQTEVRFNWFNLSYRYQTTDMYWGTSYYTLDTASGRPLITRKKIVLKNDRINQVVDVYHV